MNNRLYSHLYLPLKNIFTLKKTKMAKIKIAKM